MIFSFVIHNYKTRNLLKQCLVGLKKLDIQVPHEIIVVDGGSHDGSDAMVRALFPDVKLVTRDYNTGHAVGNNLGIREATGKYIWLLNTDIIFLDNPIEQVLQFLESNEHIGILGPKLLNPNKTVQTSAFAFYKLLTPAYRRTMLGKTPWGKKDIARFVLADWDRQTSRSVDWVMSSCMVIRKNVLDAIGPMDERFFLYFADMEWCQRCKKAGFDVYYLASVDCVVHYFARESAVKMGITSLRNRATMLHIKDYMKYLANNKDEWKFMLSRNR